MNEWDMHLALTLNLVCINGPELWNLSDLGQPGRNPVKNWPRGHKNSKNDLNTVIFVQDN